MSACLSPASRRYRRRLTLAWPLLWCALAIGFALLGPPLIVAEPATAPVPTAGPEPGPQDAGSAQGIFRPLSPPTAAQDAGLAPEDGPVAHDGRRCPVAATVCGGDRTVLGWMNVAHLYRVVIETLRALDRPEGAKLKTEIARAIRAAWERHRAANPPLDRRGRCEQARRLLLGAIEMYNLDHEVAWASGVVDQTPLASDAYLNEPVACPRGATFTYLADAQSDTEIACSWHGTLEKPVADPEPPAATATAPAGPDVDRFIAAVLDFDHRGLFRPTGGLWVGVGPNLDAPAANPPDPTGAVLLEADAKPGELTAWLERTFPGRLASPTHRTDTVVTFPVPAGGPPGTLTLSTRGLFIDSRCGTGNRPVAPDWQGFIDATRNPRADLLVEVGGPFIASLGTRFAMGDDTRTCLTQMQLLGTAVDAHNRSHPQMMAKLDQKGLKKAGNLASELRCPMKGTYDATGNLTADGRIRCSLHGTTEAPKVAERGKPDPRRDALLALRRVRLAIGRDECRLAAAFAPDQGGKLIPALRKVLDADLAKAKAEACEQARRELGSGSDADPAATKVATDYLEALHLETEGSWLALVGPGVPADAAELVPAAIGQLADLVFAWLPPAAGEATKP